MFDGAILQTTAKSASLMRMHYILRSHDPKMLIGDNVLDRQVWRSRSSFEPFGPGVWSITPQL